MADQISFRFIKTTFMIKAFHFIVLKRFWLRWDPLTTSWFSFKQIVTFSMELASFHSASKGYLNECGLRSGYVELYNFETAVLQSLITALSIKMCSTVLGQVRASDQLQLLSFRSDLIVW